MASSLSNFAENELNDALCGNGTYGAAAGPYLSLHSADPGETGASELAVSNGYAREITSFGASSGGVAQIDTLITFTASGGDWSQATHWGLWDASSAGNFLIGGDLTTPRTVSDGEDLDFAATTGLSVTFT